MKKGFDRYWVGVLFVGVLLVEIVLAKKWSDEYFIYLFNNAHVFLNSVGRAYAHVMNSGGWALDPGVFVKHTHCGVGTYWPPAVATVNLGSLFVVPVEWFFLVNFIYLSLIMWGLYALTKKLIGDRFYSLLAAVIFSCYWFVMIQLVSYEIQLGATACIVWAFYWYLRSSSFTHLWPSALVGVFMAAGLYSDRLAPGIYMLAFFIVPSNFREGRQLLHMVVALVVAGALVWPFYQNWFTAWVLNMQGITGLFSQQDSTLSIPETYKVILMNPGVFMAHLTYYFISFTEKLLGYGFTAALVVGGTFLHRLKKEYVQVILIAAAFPLTVFILIAKKDYTYAFPLCVYGAIVTAAGIYYIKNKIVRVLLIALMFGLIVVQFFMFFAPQYNLKQAFFSQMFGRMRAQRAPTLFLGEGYGYSAASARKLSLVLAQIRAISNNLLPPNEVVVLDLKDEKLQQSLSFALSVGFYQLNSINASFWPSYMGINKDCERTFFYVLSDKREYRGENGVKAVAGCSWSEVKVEYSFAGNSIKLYKVTNDRFKPL